jgi:SAM-dependent methyltransferase
MPGPWRWAARGYHHRLKQVYKQLVPTGARVLEIGCGRGDLLASLSPRLGVGVDFSSKAIEAARDAHTRLTFVQADAHRLPFAEADFDYIILSDLANDLWDVQGTFEEVRRVAATGTHVIINVYSRVWEYPLSILKRLQLSRPMLPQNWLTVADLFSLLRLAGLEPIRNWPEVLLPLRIPLVEPVLNRFIARIWPLYFIDLSNFLFAKLEEPHLSSRPTVSVIVPARNEAGRIQEIVDRVPQMGSSTEIIFVEGHSVDHTLDAIAEAIRTRRERQVSVLKQVGEGKGDAVRLGFEHSSGDILMILDADLTVAPEDLPRFYDALVKGRAELANGVRLVYPMEDRAMRLANLFANKSFGYLFSWILGQPVKDTLCGTKALWRHDYDAIARNRAYFGEFDPFGDFDLLFGAAKLGLKITDIPIRYRERTYGTTNIRRWRHGLLLCRMVIIGARRLRFV